MYGFSENLLQWIIHTTGRLNVRNHHGICIDLREVDIKSGVADQLGKKRALRPAVSLPEGMEHVDNAIEFCNVFYGNTA